MSITHLEALLLTHKNILHTLINIRSRSLGVGNLVSSTDLLAQALLEIRLGALVLLNLALQVATGNIDLFLRATITRTGGLFDALEEIAQVAEGIVDLVLDVIHRLVGVLVLLVCARVKQGILSGGQLAFALGLQIRNSFVDFPALIQDSGCSATLLVVRAHFCRNEDNTLDAINRCKWTDVMQQSLTIAAVSLLHVIGLAIRALVIAGLAIGVGLRGSAVGVVLTIASLATVEVLVLSSLATARERFELN